MILQLLLASQFKNDAVGYQRLVGEFSGPMYFYDRMEKSKRSFQIDLKIFADEHGSTWTVKYRYMPPNYQLEFYTGTIDLSGNQWTERGLEMNIDFQASNWKEFTLGRANWFEIERTMPSKEGPYNFRRRFTIKANGDFWSEKWIRFPGKEWEFSHRMELKKTINK